VPEFLLPGEKYLKILSEVPIMWNMGSSPENKIASPEIKIGSPEHKMGQSRT